MQTKKYAVKREHIGDGGRLYSPGGEFATREAFPNEVQHLVDRGVLEEVAETPADEAKSEGKKPKAEKAAKAAPENKAEKPADEAKNEG